MKKEWADKWVAALAFFPVERTDLRPAELRQIADKIDELNGEKT